MTGVAQGGGSGCVHGGSGLWRRWQWLRKLGHRRARVAVQVRQWLLEAQLAAAGGSGFGRKLV